jgi:hypothetical protein
MKIENSVSYRKDFEGSGTQHAVFCKPLEGNIYLLFHVRHETGEGF